MSKKPVINKAITKDPNYYTWFGAVKTVLREKQINQKKMAFDLGINYYRLSRVISGVVSMVDDSEDVRKINEYLGIRAKGRKIINT